MQVSYRTLQAQVREIREAGFETPALNSKKVVLEAFLEAHTAALEENTKELEMTISHDDVMTAFTKTTELLDDLADSFLQGQSCPVEFPVYESSEDELIAEDDIDAMELFALATMWTGRAFVAVGTAAVYGTLAVVEFYLGTVWPNLRTYGWVQSVVNYGARCRVAAEMLATRILRKADTAHCVIAETHQRLVDDTVAANELLVQVWMNGVDAMVFDAKCYTIQARDWVLYGQTYRA